MKTLHLFYGLAFIVSLLSPVLWTFEAYCKLYYFSLSYWTPKEGGHHLYDSYQE